jgi:iron complex outermembrane receptor protein
VEGGAGWTLGVSASRTERAFGRGTVCQRPAGTQAFEIGDVNLKTSAPPVSRPCARRGDAIRSSFAYHSWFGNFIYEDPTGVTEDGLPVYRRCRQRRALWL